MITHPGGIQLLYGCCIITKKERYGSLTTWVLLVFGLPLTNRKSSSYENMHSNICLLAGLRSNEPIRGSRARFDLNIGQFSSAAMHSQDKREYDEDGNKKVARGGEEHQFITAEISSLTVDGVQNRRGPRALLLLHSVLHRLMITP